MTVNELNTANEAYALLTNLNTYYAGIADGPLPSVPASISSSLPSLAADMQSGTLAAIQLDIDDAQTAFDNL